MAAGNGFPLRAISRFLGTEAGGQGMPGGDVLGQICANWQNGFGRDAQAGSCRTVRGRRSRTRGACAFRPTSTISGGDILGRCCATYWRGGRPSAGAAAALREQLAQGSAGLGLGRASVEQKHLDSVQDVLNRFVGAQRR